MERRSEEVEGFPLEFLRYFHSTPARYVVEAAFRRGILGTRSSGDYTLDRLAGYVGSVPGNLFEVFHRLYRNERDDLQSALFADKSVMEAVERFIGSVCIPPSATWLGDFARLVYAVSRWEREAGQVTQRLMQAFKERVGKDERFALFRSLDLALVTFWLFAMRNVDLELAREMPRALDYTELGLRSSNVSFGTFKNFIKLSRQAHVSPQHINAFCAGLDFKALGERAREEHTGLSSVRDFLLFARQTKASPDNLNAFFGGLDFKALGERAREGHTGLPTVKRFIELARQAHVSPEHINAFCGSLDFKTLGERARGVGLRTVKNFLKLVRQAKVNPEDINGFCGALDWQRLGQELGPTVNTTSPLFDFHGVRSNPGITADMAKYFVEGMGWDAVRSILDAPNAPDVIAALRALLMKKCCYDPRALGRRNIAFCSETWLRSFMERGCAEVSPNQSGIQSNYLRYAVNGLRGNPAQPLSRRLGERKLELKHWNVLIHNLKLADTEFFRAELEPLLQHMPQPGLTRLLRDADMLNLSVFASRFAPDTGEFTWRPRVDLALDDLDFSIKIRSIPLIDIAHPLFALRYLGQPACCGALADALDRDPRLVLEKLAAADLKTLEFFLWNLLTARDGLRASAL